MNRHILRRSAAAVVIAGLAVAAQSQTGSKDTGAGAGTASSSSPTTAFELSSPDIANEQKISETHVYNSFGCHGRNISPALSWRGAPAGTKSFALLVLDPDAPKSGGWWHWVVYDIPADVTSLPAAAGEPKKHLMPASVVQGPTDFGAPGYGGPCPPPGKPHRYFFRLYALKVAKLDIAANAPPALVDSTVRANALGEAQILGLYGR
ncbi:MAG TPA: YbhB/YbcL family Raf kinase inhibitor-like protein [Steroidobacteraceae bacterium]|nr:YbhB/YbcL family Raf kinase inhibitor-like protein [Steroidobacteraceae bacterium]